MRSKILILVAAVLLRTANGEPKRGEQTLREWYVASSYVSGGQYGTNCFGVVLAKDENDALKKWREEVDGNKYKNMYGNTEIFGDSKVLFEKTVPLRYETEKERANIWGVVIVYGTRHGNEIWSENVSADTRGEAMDKGYKIWEKESLRNKWTLTSIFTRALKEDKDGGGEPCYNWELT